MKHKIIQRYKEYHSGDYYSYEALCNCRKHIGSWSQERTEELIKEHLKQGKEKT